MTTLRVPYMDCVRAQRSTGVAKTLLEQDKSPQKAKGFHVADDVSEASTAIGSRSLGLEAACSSVESGQGGYVPLTSAIYDPLDIDCVRDDLEAKSEMAVTHLVTAALKHASEAITHTDRKIVDVFRALKNAGAEDRAEFRRQGSHVMNEMKNWMMANRFKTVLMVIGLGGTACKAKTIGKFMEDRAQSFIDWGRSTTITMRFLGFIGLMAARLCVSTLVPPTSPGFGIILQAATPATEKWTAMPLFLAASTAAGAVPYLLDKLIQIFSREDFMFTRLMRRFVDTWPLTCWTGPAMAKVFRGVGGGKLGASLAVIVAHAAPFMGAQTTMTQRRFLPHPLDTIISQPFGMSEDLLSMAMAEASSNPILASASLTALICGFNLAQFAVFSKREDRKALGGAMLNAAMGLVFFAVINVQEPPPPSNSFSGMSPQGPSKAGLAVVACQMALQLLGIPILTGLIVHMKNKLISIKLPANKVNNLLEVED